MNNTLENLEVINILITNDKYRLDTIIEEEPKDKRLNNKITSNDIKKIFQE